MRWRQAGNTDPCVLSTEVDPYSRPQSNSGHHVDNAIRNDVIAGKNAGRDGQSAAARRTATVWLKIILGTTLTVNRQ